MLLLRNMKLLNGLQGRHGCHEAPESCMRIAPLYPRCAQHHGSRDERTGLEPCSNVNVGGRTLAAAQEVSGEAHSEHCHTRQKVGEEVPDPLTPSRGSSPGSILASDGKGRACLDTRLVKWL